MGCSYFEGMMRSFSALDEVEAILLAGSRATNTDDDLSDYDVYIYVNTEIPLSIREEITATYCRQMELNNQFWETEDDGVLIDGTEIELIYRDLNWLDRTLERTLFHFQASTGYSTCFWSNLLNSEIIYDRSGKAKKLMEKYQVGYPEQLKKNIVRKNYPLLNQQMPAYNKQIIKAIKRNDAVSVNHRVAELLASYFDIIFALNEIPHPGEKRLVETALVKCHLLPEQFENNIETLLRMAGEMHCGIHDVVDQLVEHLSVLLQQEDLSEEVTA